MKILYDNKQIVAFGGYLTATEAAGIVADSVEGADASKVSRVPETDAERRLLLRETINASAGDPLSQMGTISDAAQLMAYHLFKMVKKLSEAQDLAAVRAATADLLPHANDVLTSIDNGSLRLTPLLKGEAAVISEFKTRSTAVTDALKAAMPAQGGSGS